MSETKSYVSIQLKKYSNYNQLSSQINAPAVYISPQHIADKHLKSMLISTVAEKPHKFPHIICVIIPISITCRGLMLKQI